MSMEILPLRPQDQGGEVSRRVDRIEHQAHNLALREMTAPIESALNKAMKGASILRLDEEDEAEDAFVNGEEEGFPNPDPDPKPELPIIYPSNPEGPIEAKEITKPTGVRIDFWPRAKLEGKWSNHLSMQALRGRLR